MVATIVKLSCAAVLAFTAVSAQAQEVLVNGNFESGLTGWTSYTTANGTIAELPSLPGAPAPQSASVALFNTTGSGASNALFLNAGKYLPTYGVAPYEGGGVAQTFTLATAGLASFSADIAAYYTRTSASGSLGLLSVLIDDNVLASYEFDGVSGGPVTLRGTLGFETLLSAGEHTIKLQATRLYAPGRGVTSQYFDNVSLAVTPVPEPVSWGLMIGGFAFAGAALRHRRAKVAFA